MAVGLVLGGGGLVGQAYEAAALAAIEHDFGWDPRTADAIVGTSAGAITGSLLRLGVPASDLAAWCVRASLSRDGAPLISGIAPPSLEPMPWRRLLVPRLPGISLARGVLGRRTRPLSAVMTLVPDATTHIGDHLGFLEERGSWPAELLRICTVRRADGERVVFDSSATAAFKLAVSASCALPGYFAAVKIDGAEYLDGGLHSPTNADVLALDSTPPDLVIVVSPMSYDESSPRTLMGTLRRVAKLALRREVRALRSAGVEVVVVEPGLGTLAAMGDDFMDASALSRVVTASFLDTGAQLGSQREVLERRLGARTLVHQ